MRDVWRHSASIAHRISLRYLFFGSLPEKHSGTDALRSAARRLTLKLLNVYFVEWSSSVENFAFAILATLLSLNVWGANKPARRALPEPTPQQPTQGTASPLIVTMGQELDREMPILSKATPSAYFVSYILTSSDRSEVMGSNGALLSSEESHSRWLETQVRAGTYDLDNTHKVGNSAPVQGSFGMSVPIDDAHDVLRCAMWQGTHKQFRAASEGLIKINTSKEVQVQTDAEHAPDFAREE